MYEISSHGCSFLGRLYLEIEKQGLSGAERRDDLQAAARQRARRGGSGGRPLPLIAMGSGADSNGELCQCLNKKYSRLVSDSPSRSRLYERAASASL
jgi:hypothetical protein